MPIFKRFAKRNPTIVGNIMSSPPITATENSTIKDAAGLMWSKKVGCLIIIDEQGKIAGVITERDMLYSAANDLIGKGVTVSTVMSKNVVTIDLNGTIPQAIEKMRAFNVRHLPVVGSDGVPMGLLSLRDLLDLAFEFLSVLNPPD